MTKYLALWFNREVEQLQNDGHDVAYIGNGWYHLSTCKQCSKPDLDSAQPPTPNWPALMDTPAFRVYCEATVRADEAEMRAEHED